MWSYEFFYIDKPDGIKPVEQWLNTQNPKVRAKLDWILKNHIKEHGLSTRGDILHHVLGKEFYQITWLDRYRCLTYVPEGTQTFVLLHAFIKKSDNTPEGEASVARKHKDIDERRRKTT